LVDGSDTITESVTQLVGGSDTVTEGVTQLVGGSDTATEESVGGSDTVTEDVAQSMGVWDTIQLVCEGKYVVVQTKEDCDIADADTVTVPNGCCDTVQFTMALSEDG